ncbi:Conglutin beta 1 [Rhynchospora pubera]|uniref:Conglutin beta 1 n=1 Tax=Rhynchospora pubera TaxID=906938 RepID=A0AAV8DS03_9POAL|nr:Conglutin beta 1 [Rhynchospora pubera]
MKNKKKTTLVFGRERLRYEIRSDRGYMKVLDKFHEKSKLLIGIANYSISLLVANPRTFVTPLHFDADCVCYMVEVLYLVSSYRRKSLVLVKFLRSTSLTGQITNFYAAGGENPESVYRSFRDEVLEAAFNVPRDRFERVFSKQREGVFIEASEEQIQALSRYSADSDDDRKLGRLNLRVSLENISEGAMMAPLCNSRFAKFAVVTKGSGYVEILCPHMAHQDQHCSQPHRYMEHEEEQEEMGRGGIRYGEEEEYQEGRWQGQRYRRVRAHISRGTIFIVPSGHPVVEVHDQNLQTICFEIRADRNERIFLAGVITQGKGTTVICKRCHAGL